MEKKQYNPEIPLFATRSGNGARVFVDAKVYDILQKAEIGTSLFLAEVPEERRAKAAAAGKNAPTHTIVIMPPMDRNNNTPTVAKKAATKGQDDL